LREGQKISYEIVADRRSGKSSADNLRRRETEDFRKVLGFAEVLPEQALEREKAALIGRPFCHAERDPGQACRALGSRGGNKGFPDHARHANAYAVSDGPAVYEGRTRRVAGCGTVG